MTDLNFLSLREQATISEVIDFYNFTKPQQKKAWQGVERIWRKEHRHRFYPYNTAHRACAEVTRLVIA